MNDQPTEDRLRSALRDSAGQVRPTPALQGVLHRARTGGRTSSSRRWLPAMVAAGATAAVVAGFVVVSQTAGEPVDAPVASGPVSTELYAGRFGGGLVAADQVQVDGDDAGVQAVDDLFGWTPNGSLINWWSIPRVGVTSVTEDDGQVVVDLSGSLDYRCDDVIQGEPAGGTAAGGGISAGTPSSSCIAPDADQALQQLALTVTQALDTDDPVLVTLDGEPITSLLGQRVDAEVTADQAAVAD